MAPHHLSNGQAMEVEIYSEYPFKPKEQRENRDPGGWRAATLQKLSGPDQPEDFSEVTSSFGEFPGQYLRYARVIRMETNQCCNCHNDVSKKHPEWWDGKTWEPTDVRAIIDVTIKLDW
jgi:hypothetical protein